MRSFVEIVCRVLSLAATLVLAACGGGGGVTAEVGILQASPAAIVFRAETAADPQPQTVRIISTGGAAATGLSVEVVATGASAVVANATLDQTTTPAMMVVAVQRPGPDAGTHRFTLRVRSADPAHTIDIPGTLTVEAVVGIRVESPTIAFQGFANGQLPASRSVAITATQGASFNDLAVSISYQSGQLSGWLQAALDRAATPAQLTVQVPTMAMPPGGYQATIIVQSVAQPLVRTLIQARLTLEAPPIISLSQLHVSLASTGAGSPPSETVQVVNAGSGVLSGLSAAISFSAGQPTSWLQFTLATTTAPTTLALTVVPGTLPSGAYEATVTLTGTNASPVGITIRWVKSGIAAPIMGTSTVSGTTINLQWTYSWPIITQGNDQYILEQSTTGPSTGFSQVAVYNTRLSPYSVSLTRPNGSYWFRVQARQVGGLTDYSAVRLAQVGSTTAARFVNNAAWSIVYLTIDGVQLFPNYLQGVPPTYYWQQPLTPGSHTYEARTGSWNPNGTRFEMYVHRGTFNATAGAVREININNPTIAQLLTRFGTTGTWYTYWWDSQNRQHVRSFRFNSGGSFQRFDDGMLTASGTYSQLSYILGTVTFRVSYSGGESTTGYFTELAPGFWMNNGPLPFPRLDYMWQY